MHKCMNVMQWHIKKGDASTQFFNCWSEPVNRETSERETSDGDTRLPSTLYVYTTGERREEKRERDSWLAIKR